MKKILFIHDHYFKRKGDTYYSGGGLPSSVWSRYLTVFPQLVVVGRDGGFFADENERYTISSTPGVDFVLLPNVSNVKSLVFGNSTVQRACRDLVASSDGVIARMPSRLAQIFVSEAIKQDKPYAVEVVGCAWGGLWDYGNWKGKFYAPISALNARRVIKRADFALYVTESYLQRRYPSDGTVEFCSNVDIPQVPEYILEKRLAKHAKAAGKVIFGLIGNYSSSYKGIDVAIRALANLKGIDWQFEVVGGGDSSIYVSLADKLGVVDKVKFLGVKPAGTPIYEWLDGVDVYLQPSYQEGLPRALVEAMSRGCPSLATSIAGIPELLSESEMISPGDWHSLSKMIKSLVSNSDLMSLSSRKNFNVAKNYYRHVLDARRTAFWSSFARHLDRKTDLHQR